MNARLKKVKDGVGNIGRNEVVWFNVAAGFAGVTRKESGEIYWPFALVWSCASEAEYRYHIVHLPSGYWFIGDGPGVPRRKALSVVRRLRAGGDWSFTKPKGPKWDAVKVKFGPLFLSMNKRESADARGQMGFSEV